MNFSRKDLGREMTHSEIVGIGNDLIECERIRQVYVRFGKAFLERIFHIEEIAYCLDYQDPIPHIAGKFAAKEAVAKALGLGFGADLAWHDIKILKKESGQPYVLLQQESFLRLDKPHLLVTISHTKELAFAVALCLKQRNG